MLPEQLAGCCDNFRNRMMTRTIEDLIQALREELQSYGEMLARLDRQQELVMHHAPNDLLQATVEIEAQNRAMLDARRLRMAAQQVVALDLDLAGDTEIDKIVLKLPADFRPLISALVRENGESLARVHQLARHNHILLCRSLELMSRLLGGLLPGSGMGYTEKGDVLGAFALAKLAYQTTG